MSDSITEFRKGNKWFVDALNAVIKYARGHGVNPAGVPGWSWTVDGWKPPRGKGGGDGLSRLDIVAGVTEGTKKLREPMILAGINDLHTSLEITNDEVTLAPDSWLVFRVDNVNPAPSPFSFTLEVVDAESGGAIKPYTFDPEDDTLTEAVIPIYRLTSQKIDSFSESVGEGLFATRVINGDILVLSSRFVQVPDKPIARFVPVLISL
jgi:hypothetical protein